MNKRRILIANSDRLTQKSLYEMLCRNEYKVDIAESVKETLTYLEESLYQVILTDINTTGGVELLREVKVKEYPSKICLWSAWAFIDA